jgi:plastocyanin domain-containing protein
MKTRILALVLFALLVAATSAFAAGHKSPQRRIPVTVTPRGFEPDTIAVKPGEHVVLVVTRTTERTCARAFTIPERKVHEDLPLNRAVEIRFTAGKAGLVRFACGMDMVSGALVVE